MRERFPNLRALHPAWRAALAGADTVAPETTNWPWSQIGTAIDYRLRFYFTSASFKELVAALGARLIARESEVWALRLARFAAHVDARIPALSQRARLTDDEETELNQLCFVLALLDEPYRSGVVSPLLLELDDLNEIAASLTPAWIDDLNCLSRTFATSQADLLCGKAVCNPTFLGSRFIGGADADMVVDHCLLEVKTNKKPKASWETFYQLVGYVLLDLPNDFEIKDVGVYLARQGVLVRWTLDNFLSDLAGEPVDLDATRKDFWEFVGFVGFGGRPAS